MNVAEWVIMVILATTLFIFLVVGIIAMIKLIQILNRVKKVSDAGAKIADTGAEIVDSVKTGVSSVIGQVAGGFASGYMNNRDKEDKSKKGK
ncbi:hypothetical protein IJI55_00010 [Candidatus Saccharibacteria bacterium]|nr:hypothetical protein [Candidatus Saccharibacteria bacterium]MBR3323738.1 hypothetical protein [Candidatus Saccharibacteria bacterium]